MQILNIDIYAILIAYLGLALILAKIMGSLFERYKLPAVLGEITTGVILGASFVGIFFPYITWFYGADEFHYPIEHIGHIGILLLLFISGMETDVRTLKKTGKVATISTVMGVITPFILGYIAGILMRYSNQDSMVLGALLTATSIGVTARTMMDLGVLSSDVGTASLSASVMDDFLGIIMIIIAIGASSLMSLAIVGINMTLLILLELVIGIWVIKYVVHGMEKVKTTKSLLGMSLGIMLIFAAFAQMTVQAAIEGAFFAGIILGTTPESKIINEDVKALSYGFFIPLFFVYIGSLINLQVFTDMRAIILAVVIVIIAIVGKVIGRAVGARMGGFNWIESLQMGIGSIPRMEVALVSIMIAIKAGAVKGELADIFLAATMIFVTVTTLITPPLLKWAFSLDTGKNEENKESKGDMDAYRKV